MQTYRVNFSLTVKATSREDAKEKAEEKIGDLESSTIVEQSDVIRVG